MSVPDPSLNAVVVARILAERLDLQGQTYALGGAIALGYWGLPHSTVNVDVTVYLSPEKPSECVWLLQDIGCDVSVTKAIDSLREHGFCRVSWAGLNVNVFLPIVPFYEAARIRRKRVLLGQPQVWIWDAESLAVFKMMFFRRKDIADVEQILRSQGVGFNRDWVRQQLAEMYGARDPRLAEWDNLVTEIPSAKP